jgi:hypothetical protein
MNSIKVKNNERSTVVEFMALTAMKELGMDDSSLVYIVDKDCDRAEYYQEVFYFINLQCSVVATSIAEDGNTPDELPYVLEQFSFADITRCIEPSVRYGKRHYISTKTEGGAKVVKHLLEKKEAEGDSLDKLARVEIKKIRGPISPEDAEGALYGEDLCYSSVVFSMLLKEPIEDRIKIFKLYRDDLEPKEDDILAATADVITIGRDYGEKEYKEILDMASEVFEYFSFVPCDSEYDRKFRRKYIYSDVNGSKAIEAILDAKERIEARNDR